MNQRKFTDTYIKNLKPQPHRYEVWSQNGLGLRISPKGTKSWIHMYRYGGKARRATFGIYPAVTLAEARKMHGEALVSLREGKDPGAALVQSRIEERQAMLISTLVDEYIERWAKVKKRTWREDQRMLESDVLPAWGQRKAKDITKRDVLNLLDKIVDRGAPIAANRTLEVIRRMFNFAIERDLLSHNPCQGIPTPSTENQRERVLNTDEIRRFWLGIDKLEASKHVKLALKLLLVTAQRRSEVVSMEWNEIDFESGIWTIPKEKAKNGHAHRVPLPPLALQILAELHDIAGASPYVFPSPTKESHITPSSLNRAISRNRQLLALEDFRPHDLRRTAASSMTSLGVDRLVVSKILNHVDSSITAVYDKHSYDSEKRKSLTLWSDYLNKLLLAQ